MKKILVTTALPYANGNLHLGHLLEHIQSDIWVRNLRMAEYSCISVCADDAHGAPIMLKAEKLGIKAEELIAKIQQSHEKDFAAFAINYDSYHSTHSIENQLLVTEIFKKLEGSKTITTKVIPQFYDPVKQMFLPDRYIKGTCPKCFAADQYGDSCEACGATYTPTELIDPRSVISGTLPILKESLHYFFDLPKFSEFLKLWISEGHLQPQIRNKLDEWFNAGLLAWDISRDAPYFGFEIPGTDKFFYVWLDAPIGYMASFKKYCQEKNLSFAEYWDPDSSCELFHFVGKDIIYFHALFWPAILQASGYRLPTSIFCHGFLTINGQKMSKSRGTFIEAATYLNHLNPEFLRYYFAAKLNSHVEDLDLNFDDFTTRINSDLIGKVINIASRSAGFIHKYFQNSLGKELMEPALFANILNCSEEIKNLYQDREYSRAVRKIMECADQCNKFIDNNKPWVLVKNNETLPQVQAICTLGLNVFRLLIAFLKPILPFTAVKVEKFLNCKPLTWESIHQPLLNHKIEVFTPLMMRVDPEKVTALLAEAKNSLT